MAVDLSTPEKCVTHGSRIFTKGESELKDVLVTFRKLPDVFIAAHELGMMGDLQALHLEAAAWALHGKIAEVLDLYALLHREATDIAIANGVDQVTGVDGGVVTLGGGGR